jgi:hypothetical protein
MTIRNPWLFTGKNPKHVGKQKIQILELYKCAEGDQLLNNTYGNKTT